MNIDYPKIHHASSLLRQTSDVDKNAFLSRLQTQLKMHTDKILRANEQDMRLAKAQGCAVPFLQRLHLDAAGLEMIGQKVADVRRLESGIGEVIEQRMVENGVMLIKRRTSIGVIAVIYESRPEVTIDVAVLCIKSGNAAILKGGSEALCTNQALYECVLHSLEEAHLPGHAVTLVSSRDRRVTDTLLKQHRYVDLVIARGGYDLVDHVLTHSTIPVLAHAAGGARIYIDRSADLSIVDDIIINAKVSKPAACNALDTVLVHTDIVSQVVPQLVQKLHSYAVKIHGDETISHLAHVQQAKATDWSEESQHLRILIKVVSDTQEAIDHIHLYTKKHSEGIIATDRDTIAKFTSSIDAAAVFVNCSTRLHDGYVFGLGSEMGIATGKLHARGPVGLKELTTYTWEVYGHGNTR